LGAGVAHWYSAELRAGIFSLHHRVQIGSGAHPAYPISTRGLFKCG